MATSNNLAIQRMIILVLKILYMKISILILCSHISCLIYNYKNENPLGKYYTLSLGKTIPKY